MKTWLRYFLWTFEAVLVLVAVYFEPTCCVRGTLWREAFFEGRPTSYWRGELEQWTVERYEVLIPSSGVVSLDRGRGWINFYQRKPSAFERIRAWWSPPMVIQGADTIGPRLLNAGDDAAPVLRELLNDASPELRQFTRIGLRLDSNLGILDVR